MKTRRIIYAALCAAGLAGAQDATQTELALKRSGYIEFGVSYDELTGGNRHWDSQFVRLNTALSERDRLDAELAMQSRFGERAVMASAGVTHIFNEDWYARVAAGAGTGGFFVPNLRLDASLSRKWLPARNLVTTLGAGYINSRGPNHDRYLQLSGLYYFERPFIVELGTRFNRSSPGSVNSTRYFGALTYGQNKHRYITLRHENGGEGYQLTDENETMFDFHSRETRLIWREWLTDQYGINVELRHYFNNSYERNGIEASLFVDF